MARHHGTSMRGRGLRIGLALVLGLGAVAACGGDDDEASGPGTTAGDDGGATGVVRIGVNEPLSGDIAPFGAPAAAGVRLAVDEINEAGGFEVDGVNYTFEIVEVDNRGDAAAAVAGALELIEDEGINIIFGPTPSSLANQVAEITAANDVLHLSPATSWQASALGYLQDPSKPLLYGTQTYAANFTGLLADAAEELGSERVGLLAEDNDVTAGNLPGFQAAFEEAGIPLVEVLFPPDTTDLTPFVTRLRDEGVDTFFYYYPVTRAAEAIALGLELGIAEKGVLGWAGDTEVAISGAIGGPLPVPFMSVNVAPSFEAPPDEVTADFVERLFDAYPDLPRATANYSLFMYDPVFMLAEAMKAAGTTEDVEAIAAALEDIVWDGVTGTSCWDGRQLLYPGSTISVIDGELVPSESKPVDCPE